MTIESNQQLKIQIAQERRRMVRCNATGLATLWQSTLSRIEELEYLAKPRRMPVLMNANNPDGWALESLALQLASEVIAKDLKIQNDARPQVIETSLINKQIVDHLHAIRTLQEQTRTLFAELGKDQGPLGKPRAGVGCE